MHIGIIGDTGTRFNPQKDGPRWGLFYGQASAGGEVATWAELGRRLEEQVFVESLGYTHELVREEYELWDPMTIWIVIANLHEGEAVGAMRVLVGDPRELKLTHQLEEFWQVTLEDLVVDLGLGPDDRLVECATISVARGWRRADRHWPAKALIGVFGHLMQDLDVTGSIQLQDVSGPRLMRRLIGRRFEVMGDLEPVDYLGPVVPTFYWQCHTREEFLPHADEELLALYIDRDESVRGGTALPVIDLRDPAGVLRSGLNLTETDGCLPPPIRTMTGVADPAA